MSRGKIKSFKDFIKGKKKGKKVPPILVTALPVHGKHAHSKQNIKEDSGEVLGLHKWLEHPHNEHLGHSEDDVHKKLEHPEEEWSKHYSDEHHRAIAQYTSSSIGLNKSLISHAEHGPSLHYDVTKDNDHVKHLDDAMTKHPLKHDLHLFHGTNAFNPGKLAAKHPDRKIKFPAYLSASHTPRIAHDYAFHVNQSEGGGYVAKPEDRHIIHIHAKAGQHGIYIGEHGFHGNEHEFMMPRNTTLKVHHEPTKLGDGTHVWHAHVVHEDD